MRREIAYLLALLGSLPNRSFTFVASPQLAVCIVQQDRGDIPDCTVVMATGICCLIHWQRSGPGNYSSERLLFGLACRPDSCALTTAVHPGPREVKHRSMLPLPRLPYMDPVCCPALTATKGEGVIACFTRGSVDDCRRQHAII